MAATHGIAIIGFGGMGGWHHLMISEKVPSMHICGIYDIAEEARQKARQLGLHVYPTISALLEDKEAEIALIAVPNHLHEEYCLLCLQAGKHVICEKPVTLSSAALEHILEVRQQENRLFSVHQNRRWDRDYQIVQRVLESGKLGDLHFVESRVQGASGSMREWRGVRSCGGGILLDWGVHLIDQILQLFPQPVLSVQGILSSVHSKEVDDADWILLRFAKDVSVLLEMTTSCFQNLPRWRLMGSEGTAIIEDWSCKGSIRRIRDGSEFPWSREIVYTEAGPTRTLAPQSEEFFEKLPLPAAEANWSAYYQNFIAALDGTAELAVNPQQTLRVMKIVDAIFLSQKNGASISCEI